MGAYAINRIVSIAVPLSFICVVLALFGNTPQAWKALLIGTTLYAYTHFFVGWYFQLGSIGRSTTRQRDGIAFCTLVLFTLAVVAAFFVNGLMLFFSLFMILYFILHGFMNECTLYEREVGKPAPRYLLGSIAFFLAFLTLQGTTHPSAFFSSSFELIPYSTIAPLIETTLKEFFTGISVVSYGFLGFALWALFTSTQKNEGVRWAVYVGGFLLITLLGVVLQSPIPYMFMYTMLLGYHFTSWIAHTVWRNWASARGRIYSLIALHIVALVISVIPLIPEFRYGVLLAFLFNFSIHTTITAVHVSTSFLNEPWLGGFYNGYGKLENTVCISTWWRNPYGTCLPP